MPDEERLVHYSAAPLSLASLQDRTQGGRDHWMAKPLGLWLSVDSCENNWREWCLGEEFGLDRLTHVHDVTLCADANVLRICNVGELDCFSAEFGGQSSDYMPPHLRLTDRVDWPAVSQRWHGIIIAPYVWKRRLSDAFSWYYSWDCASGCIWDKRAIAAIELQKIVPVAIRKEEQNILRSEATI